MEANREEKRPINALKAAIDKCKTVRRDLIPEWQTSIDYRRGKPFAEDSDEDRIAVNLDWPQTKAKIAALFSQVPAVTMTSERGPFKGIAPLVAKALNKRLNKANVASAMDEDMADVVNASGIAASIVGYQARTETKQVGKAVGPDGVPATVDLTQFQPEEITAAQAQGLLTIEDMPFVTDKRFYVTRISPADLLWDVEFAGSDFDQAAWIGRSGRMTWAEAKHEFELDDEVREKVAGGDGRSDSDRMSPDVQNTKDAEKDTVCYDEIYYWAYKYDPSEKYFKTIKRAVFIEGLGDTPHIDEPWKGQRFNEQAGTYVGACRFPIQVCTLAYISDEPVPPSDSAIGRPQVDEIIRSRSQMFQQRETSKPIRWADVNRLDPMVQDSIMRGTWQGIIPVNGDGSKAIGEIARAMYPREDFEFDRIAKADLQEQWQIGPNQMGQFASGERSASEANHVQAGFQTRIGQERARVAKFFLGIAEVMLGLMALYDDFKDALEPEQLQALDQVWDRTSVNHDWIYTIRPDSTVLLDSEQRIQRLLRVLNLLAKSGHINPEPIIREIVTLSGLDPAEVVVKPQEKGPEPINISVRNAEDLMNPLFLSLLVKSGQAPEPQDLEVAHKMIQAAMGGLTQAAPVPQPPAGPQAPSEEQLGDWQAAPRISKRPEEMGG